LESEGTEDPIVAEAGGRFRFFPLFLLGWLDSITASGHPEIAFLKP
jgi:hypothetical protein